MTSQALSRHSKRIKRSKPYSKHLRKITKLKLALLLRSRRHRRMFAAKWPLCNNSVAWPTLKHLNSKQWRDDLNHNLQEMYAGNCWGVPSFKLTDDDGGNPFYVWGQDRMWLIQEEIAKRSS